MDKSNSQREGSLDAPRRDPIAWQREEFYDETQLQKEMERVFDICHGCRRCVSLCDAFPTLFDLVDESDTMEIDGVAKADYEKVVDQCYLCDLCFMTKCPYVPPHKWALDFPHLMLRAKAVNHKQGKHSLRDRLMTSTDTIGKFAGIPIVAETLNAATKNSGARKLLDKLVGIHPEAYVPSYQSIPLRKRLAKAKPLDQPLALTPEPTTETRGQVALFITCYGNYNEPGIAEDLMAVFEHNGIPVKLVDKEQCCGMPKLELGDLEAVQKLKEHNIPQLKRLIDAGFDIVAPVPSCVLMFKQELPLLFPEDEDVQAVQRRIYDPFEYLMLRHKGAKLNTDFKRSIGRIGYHVPCHQRVQNIGPKTQEVLSLIPETTFEVIERCSGHDGTYGLKSTTHTKARKICQPVVNKLKQSQVDAFISDCPLAIKHIEMCSDKQQTGKNPMELLRYAYGIDQ